MNSRCAGGGGPEISGCSLGVRDSSYTGIVLGGYATWSSLNVSRKWLLSLCDELCRKDAGDELCRKDASNCVLAMNFVGRTPAPHKFGEILQMSKHLVVIVSDCCRGRRLFILLYRFSYPCLVAAARGVVVVVTLYYVSAFGASSTGEVVFLGVNHDRMALTAADVLDVFSLYQQRST